MTTLETAMVDLADQVAALRADLDRVTTPIAPVAYKVRDAATALGLSVSTVNGLIKAGVLHAVILPTMHERLVPSWAIKELLGDPSAVRPALEVAS